MKERITDYDLLTILGPTACGKTAFAVDLALRFDAEIISGDSRQVYRGMDIGTGKDLDEYSRGDRRIPYHLIDVAEAGTKYNVYRYQQDFLSVYEQLKAKGTPIILCGGSGLYLEAVLRGYRLLSVPENPSLRASLEGKTLAELTDILSGYKELHNTTDVDTAKRAIRAIEIEEYYQVAPVEAYRFPAIRSLNIGINISRELRRERITQRLRQRLNEGMLDEVRSLLARGVSAEDLIFYGLEYKYLTLHLIGKLSYDEMFRQLEIAIHQFAKRQMTWFRGMERRGVPVHWIDSEADLDAIVLC